MQLILYTFIIGYMIQHLATLMQIYRIRQRRNTELVSLDTNIYFLLGAITRGIWMWDSALSKFYLAYLEVLLGIGLQIYIIHLYYKYQEDNFFANIKLPVYLRLPTLLSVIALLSFCFHPGNKNDYYLSSQMIVSLSLYSEAIGLIPQLYIIKTNNETGNISSYYGVFLLVARLTRLMFWINMYFTSDSFLSLMIGDFMNFMVLCFFNYSLLKNWNKISLPTVNDSNESSGKKIF